MFTSAFHCVKWQKVCVVTREIGGKNMPVTTFLEPTVEEVIYF